MIPNHSQLINLTLGADPGFLAGRFATVTGDQDSWVVPLKSLEAPGLNGILTVNAATYVITRAELGHVRQALIIDRAEPTDQDLADLEALKSGAT
ncbi:hypothetical protein [Arthrobacter sp. ES3-54]|uniref:hypothetical protein n=1 Tax=Arthrobacter sp. ES3-54 TaxID=1502991 RepID=UPI0024052077|nr:hypothetical protein [Arthrobacter sp. ES3-54]MDF9748688.1 hypothetical protein [Arthrobacter sp. ES3-54]